MSLEDFIDRARELDVDGVSLESCFIDKKDDPGYLGSVRARLDDYGLDRVYAWGHPDGLEGGKNQNEYKEMVRSLEHAQTIRGLGEEPFTVSRDGEDVPDLVRNHHDLLEAVLTAGKKGINIQRYKGLGEMNAEQLWDTTMDPSTRTLLQVQIEDVADGDNIFTTLMGDQVEPRRLFIEANALNVKNLDI